MRIAIVTEKPPMAKAIAPAAKELFPHDTLDYLICWPIGIYAPILPRGLRWKDYPYIAPFEALKFSRRADSPMRGPMVGRAAQDGALSVRDFHESWEEFNDILKKADRIISLMDSSDHLYHFDVARRNALGSGVAPGEAKMLYSLDHENVTKAILDSSPEIDAHAQSLISYGQVRHYFHHQFAVNSLAIFGKASGGAWVSKYQLQFLYALRNQEPATEGQWVRRMGHWHGTGKYPLEQEPGRNGLGSTMSRGAILEQTRLSGWIEEREGKAKRPDLKLSDKGRALLERLHPGCEDPDLPFRIDNWARQGLEVSKPALDRYLRTFFGRQKRFGDIADNKKSSV